MKQQLSLIVGILIGLILVVYMFTFQVRYDEVAVKTTFGKATEPQRNAAGGIDPLNPGSVIVEPGINFRLPWPIQNVEKYTTRVQILDDQLEEQQTKDGYAVIVRTYLAYRVEDPYLFYKNLKSYDEAQKQISARLRGARAIISSYRFDELVNTDPEKLKLQEMELKATEELRKPLADFGITIQELGIRRVVLPEKVTEKVFERMRNQRQALAQNARSSGTATASTIKSGAKSSQDRILAFAERRAQAIRAQGDEEAAKHYEVFKQNQDFAIFLRQIDSMKKILAHNTTFILDANKISPLDLFNREPGAVADNVTKPATSK
jgi:modulator of FtsH protease HflC